MPLSALLEGDFFNLYIKTGISPPSCLDKFFLLHDAVSVVVPLVDLRLLFSRQYLDAFRRLVWCGR